MKLDHCVTPHTAINSKCTKILKVRPETIKHPEENIGCELLDVNLGDDFLILKPKAKKKKKKWDYIRLKNFCTANETIYIMKSEPFDWENICKSYM